MEAFYNKFYSDNNERRFIIGINPGRHGAGTTGVPFTDTKRLEAVCGIKMQGAHTHEVSSVFVYELIAAYGGTAKFFGDFYVNSPFPLAIVKERTDGKFLNANYYDDDALFKSTKPFMLATMRAHLGMGLNTGEAFIMGKKNAIFVKKLNDELGIFKKLTVLEHPRFIAQYRSRETEKYIKKYLDAF